MDVNRISETYSNLGRLGRGTAQQPPFQEEIERPPEQEKRPEERPEAPPTESPSSGLSSDIQLKPAEAMALTESLSAEIKQAVDAGRRADWHELTEVNLLTPRYV